MGLRDVSGATNHSVNRKLIVLCEADAFVSGTMLSLHHKRSVVMEQKKKCEKIDSDSVKKEAWREGYLAAIRLIENDEVTSCSFTDAMTNLVDIPLGLKNSDLVYRRFDGFACGLIEVIRRMEMNAVHKTLLA